MIKGTRFFSRRLLPLLLAAVMLLGMLPALTLPVLAEDASPSKITLTADSVTAKGKDGGTDRPKDLLVDGDRGPETGGKPYKYYVIGNDQAQQANAAKPADPDYWVQLDLGKEYDLSKLMLFIYHGRALKNLVVLASEVADFNNYTIIWNADRDNFFGFEEAGTDNQFEDATAAGDTIDLSGRNVTTRYLRFLNNGHTANGGGQGAHYYEIEVYGTEHTGGGTPPEPTLYNVAADCNVTLNKDVLGADRPASWLTDGEKSDTNGYIEVCKNRDQDTSDPSYAQIDLGNIYPVSKVNFWNYW